MLLKSNIDQDEYCILSLSIVTLAKKIKELVKKDEQTIADLEGVGHEMLKRQYKNYVELEYHVDQLKSAVLEEAQWSDGDNDLSKPRSFKIQMSKIDGAKRSIHKVYSDKRIITVVSVDVKKKWGYGFLTSIKVKRTNNKEYEFNYADISRLSLNDIEDMYLLKVQGKLHHLKLEFEIDFINALLFYIRRVVIKNRIEDTQLGVESYQCTLNLTKPKFYFSGIDHKIPYTTSRTEKGVIYLNKYDMKSLMKLDEVHKFCDGTLLKVQENFLKMVNKNKLGHGNEKLEGKFWAKSNIKRSKEMLDKINKTPKHKE
ncbi:hypothetical protein Tco_0732357 [Tanacetum coccineum]